MEQTFISLALLLVLLFLFRVAKMIWFTKYRIIQRKRYSFLGERTEYYIEKTDIIGWQLIHSIGYESLDDAKIGLDHYLKNQNAKSIVLWKR